MKKKWLVALLVVIVLSLLVGCGPKRYTVRMPNAGFYNNYQEEKLLGILLAGTDLEATTNPITCGTSDEGIERCEFRVVKAAQYEHEGKVGWIALSRVRER